MQESNDPQTELSKRRILCDSDDLRKLINAILASANSFNMELDLLENLHTGRSATSEISKSLHSMGVKDTMHLFKNMLMIQLVLRKLFHEIS